MGHVAAGWQCIGAAHAAAAWRERLTRLGGDSVVAPLNRDGEVSFRPLDETWAREGDTPCKMERRAERG